MSETPINFEGDHCRGRKLLAIKRRLLEKEMMEYLATSSTSSQSDLDQSNHDYEEVCFDPANVLGSSGCKSPDKDTEKCKSDSLRTTMPADTVISASSPLRPHDLIGAIKHKQCGLKKRSNSDSDLFLVDESREFELCCSSAASIAEMAQAQSTLAKRDANGSDAGQEPEQGFYRVYDDLDRIREWNLIPYVIARKHREALQQQATSNIETDNCKIDGANLEKGLPDGESPTGNCCPPGLRSDSSRVSVDSGRASVVSSNLSSYVTVRSKRLYSDSGSSCSADSGTYHLFDNNGNATTCVPSNHSKSDQEKEGGSDTTRGEKRPERGTSLAKRGHEHHKSEEFLRQVSQQLSSISRDAQNMRSETRQPASSALYHTTTTITTNGNNGMKLSTTLASLPGYCPSGTKPKKKQPRPEAYPPVPPPPPLYALPPKNSNLLTNSSSPITPVSPPPLPPRLKCTKTGAAFSSRQQQPPFHQRIGSHVPSSSSTSSCSHQTLSTSSSCALQQTIRRKDLSSYFGLLQDGETRFSKEVVKKVAIQSLSHDFKSNAMMTTSPGGTSTSSSSSFSSPGKKDLNKYLGIQQSHPSSPSSCNSSSSSPSSSSLLKRLKSSSPPSLHYLQKGQRSEQPPPPFNLKTTIRHPQPSSPPPPPPPPPPPLPLLPGLSASESTFNQGSAYKSLPPFKMLVGEPNKPVVSCRRVLDFSEELCATDQTPSSQQTPSLPGRCASNNMTPDISPPKLKPNSNNLRSSAMARLFFRNPLRLGAVNRRRSIQEGELGKKDEVLGHAFTANTPKIRKNASIRRRRSFKSASASKAAPRKSFMASLLASASTAGSSDTISKPTPRRRRAPMVPTMDLTTLEAPNSTRKGFKVEHHFLGGGRRRTKANEKIEIDDGGALNEIEPDSEEDDDEETFASLLRKHQLNPQSVFNTSITNPKRTTKLGNQNDVGLPVIPFIQPPNDREHASNKNNVPEHRPPLPVKLRNTIQDNDTSKKGSESCCENSNHIAYQAPPPPKQSQTINGGTQIENHRFAINDRSVVPKSRMSMLREAGVFNNEDKENNGPLQPLHLGESVFKCPSNSPNQHSLGVLCSQQRPQRQPSSLYLTMSGCHKNLGSNPQSSRAFEALATPVRHLSQGSSKDPSKGWWTLPHPKSSGGMHFTVDIDIDGQSPCLNDDSSGLKKAVQHCQSCTCGVEGNSNSVGDPSKLHRPDEAVVGSCELDYVPMEQQNPALTRNGPLTPMTRRRSCSLVAFSSPATENQSEKNIHMQLF